MDFNSILTSSLVLGGMGLLFGSGLAFASQKFAVEVDPRVEAINGALPGANCGGCGLPGCDAFAKAVVAGEVEVNGCPVGGAECAEKIAEIMGVSAGSGEKQVAKVLCKGTSDVCDNTANYDGITDCLGEDTVLGGTKACKYGCLGGGTCVDVCPFDAINIVNGIAEIDKDKCTACGKCIDICPKKIIDLVPYSQLVVVECNNKERGGYVKKNCSPACIACGICERSCPFDAITVENNIAKIDYDKCTNCMVCTEKCPTNAISGQLDLRKIAEIDEEKCIGCTLCKKACPVDAIEGEVKQNHKVDSEKCIGCGACEEKCPKDAIAMK